VRRDERLPSRNEQPPSATSSRQLRLHLFTIL
jgi:hypothetical protein